MWSDKESKNDYLNFGEVSSLAVDILASPSMLPVSLGVFGNWGAGKSSLLALIERDLEKNHSEYLIVKFDAWLYQGYDDSRAALIEVIARQLEEAAKGNESLLQKCKSLLRRVRLFRVLGLLGEGVALSQGVTTGGILARTIGSAEDALSAIGEEKELSAKEYKDLKNTAEKAGKTGQELVKPKDNRCFSR